MTTTSVLPHNEVMEKNTKKAGIDSEKLTIRLPAATMAGMKQIAQGHDRSLNGEIAWALRLYIHAQKQAGLTEGFEGIRHQ